MTDPTLASLPPLPLRPTLQCWICESTDLSVVWHDVIDLQWSPNVAPYNHSVQPACRLFRCNTCGFGQPAAVPDIENYYGRIYHREWTDDSLEFDYQATYRDTIYNDILKQLGRFHPGPNRSLLDIGAHTGRFVWLAHEQGWAAEGLEINPVTAEFASRRTGLPIHTQRAEELAENGKRYSAVTLNDVLEHLPEPMPILRSVTEVIVSGGVLAIKVPHGPMQRVKEGFRRRILRRDPMLDRAGVMSNFVHVNHFSVNSLRLALESVGLKVVEIRAGRSETIPWKQSGIGRGLTVRAIDRAARVIPGSVHTPLAMNLQAFAMKP